jgi:hypothetical protein
MLSSPARAFRTAGDDPAFEGTSRVRWSDDVIVFRLHQTNPSDVTLSQLRTAIDGAFSRWSTALDLQVVFQLEETDDAAVRADGINTIQFVEKGWQAMGFQTEAAGLTDLGYELGVDGAWRIVEADLYLNGEDYRWISSGAAESARSLDSVLTHETGHVLGLWHPCEVGGNGGVPDCAEDPAFAATTMYPEYSPTQSMLSPDDIAGVRYLYLPESCEGAGCVASECKDDPCQPGERCTEDGCRPDSACREEPCDARCNDDSNCESEHRCVGGVCTIAREVGGDCSSPSDCASNICAADGFCVGACSDCIEDSCRPLSDDGDSCHARRFPVGTPCESAETCLGGECLAGASSHNVCTHECGSSTDTCPEGWSCTGVGDRSVCAPSFFQARGGGGCSQGPGRRDESAWLLPFLIGALVVHRQVLSGARRPYPPRSTGT